MGRHVASRLIGAIVGAAALGQPACAQTVQRDEASLLRASVALWCADDLSAVKASSFLLALHPASIRDEVSTPPTAQSAENALRANVVIFVSVNGALLPLVLRQYSTTGELVYLVSCQGSPVADPADFPGVRIRLESADDKRDALEDLKGGPIAAGRPAPSLLLAGDTPEAALVDWPAGEAQPPTYGRLMQTFVAKHRNVTLLKSVQGGFSVESIGGEPKVIDLTRIPKPASVAGDPQADSGRSTGLIAESSGQRQKRKVQIRFVSKSLQAIDLTQPGGLDTFSYCGAVRREGTAAGAFTLEDCVTDDLGKIPFRVRGFEWAVLEVGNRPTRIDALLKTLPFSVPYPTSWQGSASDRVDVPSAPIEEVLKRPLKLRQFGLPQCESAVTPTLADLAAGTIAFPEPPCVTVDIQLPRDMFGKTLPVAEGCRPGSVAPALALADGRIRCVVTRAEMKAPSKRVRVTWTTGFDPFDLALPTAQGGKVHLAPTELAKFLRASLQAHQAPKSEPDMAAYRPGQIQYFVGSQPCAPATRLDKNTAPTLAEAGCQALPDRIDLTFEIDRERSDPTLPLDAFSQKLIQSIPLGAPNAAGRPLELSGARLSLPVDFNPERRQRYTNQYSKAAELVVQGAKVFAHPNCSEQDNTAKMKLFGKSDTTADFKWPAYAQVFDNDGRSLTNCAKASVERGEGGRPYLTFEFTSTRAAGARRTILLVRGQDMMDRPGMPKAIETAFTRFIETAYGWHKQGAPLSPVDVLSVGQDGSMRRVLSAEEAALQPQAAAQSLARIDRTAPKTPDLSLLRLQPETKGAERLLIIMDGSIATPRQVSELRLLGSDIAARNGNLQFLLSTESCVLWQPHSPQLKCAEIGTLKQSERERVLVDAMTALLNPIMAR